MSPNMIESAISQIFVNGWHACKVPAAAAIYMKKPIGTKQMQQQQKQQLSAIVSIQNIYAIWYKHWNTWIEITEINVGIKVEVLLQTMSFS